MTQTAAQTVDPRVARAKEWQPEVHVQTCVAHGGIPQQQTEYAVVKNADMSP